MTPSGEVKLRKDIAALFAANDDLDARQSKEIEKLGEALAVLSKKIGVQGKDIEGIKWQMSQLLKDKASVSNMPKPKKKG